MIPAFLLTFVEGLLGPKFSKFATPLIYGLAILLIIGASFAVVKIHDHRVIAQHEASQDATNSKADRKADEHAAVQRQVDDNRLNQEAQQLKEAQSHAQNDNDRSLARFRCIRLQQAARAAKRVVPACG